MANRFVIEVKAKGFNNLNSQLKRSDETMKNYGNSSQRAGRQTNEFRKQIALVRNNLLLYTFALTGATNVLGKFIKLASSGQEQLNQFKVVFGDQADAAMGFANTLSVAFDKSKDDVIALMAALQDTFVPLGFSRAEARALSETLAQLSFDVESFKDAQSGEVSAAFTSAIVGNHEAVRKFAISITEAEVKLAAMRLGIDNASGGLTSQQKVLARTSLIINGAKDTLGDYNNTKHEFANRVRAAQAAYKDLAIEIGNFLLPMAQAMLEFGKVSRLKGYATGLTLVGLAFLYVKRQAIAASLAMLKSRAALVKSGWGIAVIALGELANKFIFTGEEADEAEGELRDLTNAMDDLQKLADGLKVDPPNTDAFLFMHDGIDHAAKSLEKWNKHRKDFEETQAIWDAEQGHIDYVNELLDSQLDMLMSESDIIANRAAIKSAAARKEQAEIMKTAGAYKQFSDQLGRSVADGQALGPAVVNSLKAIVAELAAQAASLLLLNMFIPGGVSSSKMGFDLFASVFGHSGGAITSKGIQRFARGGMVGGGDNVPIMAQSGEFIMRRDAVQSIGLDQLHRMNQTGQSNSVTVNISAPMVDETVVDHIIPAIERTQRFNLA
jgi:hypothetical protein